MSQPLPVSQTFTRSFRFEACLGRGGFGAVYRATELTDGLERTVAVKLLHNDLAQADDAVRRLRDEARLLGLLHHPVVVRVYSLSRLDGQIAMVTEYVDGDDLKICLKAGMPQRALLEVVAQVADGLDAALHGEGPRGPLNIIHRDIKPSNIRIARSGHVRLLDFGIARSSSITRAARTGTNLFVGTWHYMAPERFLQPAEAPADVFALGSVLFEGITGEKLVKGLNPLILARLAHDPESWEAHVSERLGLVRRGRLRSLLADCLQYDLHQRPTAAEVRDRATTIAERARGASLFRWRRENSWPEHEELDDPLVGRTLTDGTLALSTPSMPPIQDLVPPLPARIPEPRQLTPWPWAAVVFLATVSVVFCSGVLGIAGVGAWSGHGELAMVEPVPTVVIETPSPPTLDFSAPAKSPSPSTPDSTEEQDAVLSSAPSEEPRALPTTPENTETAETPQTDEDTESTEPAETAENNETEPAAVHVSVSTAPQTPRPAPRTRPTPVQKATPPAPPVAPAGPLGGVWVDTDFPLEIGRAGITKTLKPGKQIVRLPVGTWTIRGELVAWQPMGEVTFQEEGVPILRCREALQSCRVQ